ncbi:MAG: hypothetical protein DRH97_04245, partial [Chloroflexi bacterium]
DHVEFETLDWVDWFNNRRLLEPVGYIPPAEFEELYYQRQEAPVMVAGLTYRTLRNTRGGSDCKHGDIKAYKFHIIGGWIWLLYLNKDGYLTTQF